MHIQSILSQPIEPIVLRGVFYTACKIYNTDITIVEAIEVLTKALASDIVEKYGIESDN